MKTQILKDKTLYVKTPEFIASPEIHSSFKSEYELTDLKCGEWVTAELVNNKVKVYNDTVTEYWNVTEIIKQVKEPVVKKTVSDQITDAVTVAKDDEILE